MLTIIREYHSNLRTWASEVVDLMTEAGHLCDLDPVRETEFFRMRNRLRYCLSASADKGRFFLPNTGVDKFGTHNPSAYRGFRSEAIDYILMCYKLLGEMDYKSQAGNITKGQDGKSLRNKIMDTKRDFVSIIQTELDPTKFENEAKARLDQGIKRQRS